MKLLVILILAAIVISLAVYIAVGNYAGRRVKKLDDYFDETNDDYGYLTSNIPGLGCARSAVDTFAGAA